MGHELTSAGLRADRRKMEAILNMPAPSDKPGVLRLLGMTGFLARFCPNYSETTAPLRELLQRDVEFKWLDDIHGTAFNKLESMLTSGTVLPFFDVTKPVVIQCDASQAGLGAAIIQNGRPLEYASRALIPVERDAYAQIEKELLAIVFAMERFQTYV